MWHGVVQQPACVGALAEGRLIQVLRDYAIPRFPLHVLIPRVRPIPARIRAALAVIKECLPDNLRSPLDVK